MIINAYFRQNVFSPSKIVNQCAIKENIQSGSQSKLLFCNKRELFPFVSRRLSVVIRYLADRLYFSKYVSEYFSTVSILSELNRQLHAYDVLLSLLQRSRVLMFFM